jgi:small subunit ribosomal protein S18
MAANGNDKGKRTSKAKVQRGRSPFAERRGKEWEGQLVDYKDLDFLRKFLTPSGKMVARKRAGTTAFEQRILRAEVKRARFMALLPFSGS